jgi:hypothetical protein
VRDAREDSLASLFERIVAEFFHDLRQLAADEETESYLAGYGDFVEGKVD